MAESGIYEIVNLVNGKRYVGSAVDLKRRSQDHWSYLRRGAHHCDRLLKAWRKYGEPAFVFRAIEHCEKEELLDREQAAIDKLSPEYNICPLAGSSRGVRHSATARANMSKAQKRHWAQPEARAALLAMVRSPEVRAKNSAKHRGKVRPDHVSALFQGMTHPRADHDIYTIRHASGETLTGVQMELRRLTGISPAGMSFLLRGKRPTAKGWRLASL